MPEDTEATGPEPPFDEIVVTHTAKSKGFRYLDEPTLKQHVQEPDEVYFSDRESWLIPVDRPRAQRQQHESPLERIVIVVDVDEDGTAVVVTQTGDHNHYSWDEYEEVPAVGVEPEGVEE